MKYTKGTIGRVFLLKFEGGDNLLTELKKLSRKENIKSASMVFIGALKEGEIVTGPKRAVIPPQPNKRIYKDGWEVMGIGTIFSNRKGPQVHIHASMGKKSSVITGCVREKNSVFLVIECIVFELRGVKASKDIDPETGLNLLRINI